MMYALNTLELKYKLDVFNAKLLDVGSATGYGLWQFMLSGFFARQLHGIDLFQDRVNRGLEMCPGLQLVPGDGSNMKVYGDKSFDVVCEQFCFVHVPLDETQRGIAKEMLRVVKDNGFIIILDKDNRVISAPGGKQPNYEGDQAGLLLQDQPVFRNVHDVCMDEAGDLYGCQWNADQAYPYKLRRV